MHAFLEDVQLDGNLRFFQGQREKQAILGRDGGILVSVGEESRWGVLGYLEFVREAFDQFGRGFSPSRFLFEPPWA